MERNGIQIDSTNTRSVFWDINHTKAPPPTYASQAGARSTFADERAAKSLSAYLPHQSEESLRFPTPFVYREGSKVSLHFQIDAVQSTMDENDPDCLFLNYTRLMMAVLLFVQNPGHIGCLGLGGGSIPKYCHRYLQQTRISVAEINPQVIALREEFNVPRDSSRFGIFQVDGAEFVAANPRAFDVLMVDAFDLHGQPLHLCSVEFYRACYEALTPDGYLVVNLCHEGKAKAISRIEHVFNRNVYCLRDCDGLNLIAIVGKEERGVFLPSLPGRARTLELTHPLFFREMAHSLSARPGARIVHRGTL